MADIATFDAPLGGGVAGYAANVDAPALSLGISVTHRLDDVEAVWRAFDAVGIESPGQDIDFVRLWIFANAIPERDQLYVVASLDGRPVALLPLHLRRRGPVRLYSWFPGTHVGCNAPLVDAGRLAALSNEQRAAFWRGVTAAIPGADLVYLRAIPEAGSSVDGLFSGLGRALPVETLYRAVFANWEDANTRQRSKSRRKHDRQQGEKLDALGAVSFEVLEHGHPDMRPVLDEMFRQRARRFEVMGIADPFCREEITNFYNATLDPASGVEVKLHVLRLDSAIVAVRYNIVHGDRLFCLISSMSDDPAIQIGSPGKQCLLRVMQTVFDEGYTTFDMGAGFTDEKRHWCNEQIALANHYVPLTPLGALVVGAHALWQTTRARIKANQTLHKFLKDLRGRFAGHAAKAGPTAEGE